MNKNTKLISQKEISRKDTYYIYNDWEDKTPISVYLYDLIFDIACKVITNHVLNEKRYEFYEESCYWDIDSEIEELIANNEVILDGGRFSPLQYSELNEFLDESSNHYYTYTDWGELRCSKESIASEIYEKIYNIFIEDKETIKKELTNIYMNLEDKKQFLRKNSIVIKENTFENKKTGEITTTQKEKTYYNQEDVSLKKINIDELIDNFLDDKNLINSFMNEIDCYPFKDIYLRGCSLLDIEDTFYKDIKYSNSEVERLLFEYIKETVVNKTYTDNLGKTIKIVQSKYHTPTKIDFKEGITITNDAVSISETKSSIKYHILKESYNPDEIDNALKLLSAIYIYEHNITVDKLNEICSVDFLKNTLFYCGLDFTVQHLFAKYENNKKLRELINVEPKLSYPLAREMKRHFILHIGGTNCGKTHDSLVRFKNAKSGVYLAPLRLLALEVQLKMLEEGLICDLLTGEEEDRYENSNHICSTVEKLDFSKEYEVAVIDEAQMLEDKQRGNAWTGAILGVCAKEIHLCLSPYAKDIIIDLIKYCDDTFEEVYHERDTELIVTKEDFDFLKDIQKGDALIAFSKRKVLNLASKINKETDMKCSVLFGSLPYKSRKKQFDDFATGKTQVLITTDAIGLGVNLAIKRVIFMEDSKFDGTNVRKLKTTELLQIGGRAGRKNIYDQGYVIMKNNKMVTTFYREIKPLENIYIGLTEKLIDLDCSLDEALLEWQKINVKKPFKKADISNQLDILNKINNIDLTKIERFKALFLPVNVNSAYELNLLREYLKLLPANSLDIKFPQMPPLEYDNQLKQYESYSKAIDLYYSFCKTYNFPLELEKVISERESVSAKINHLLLNLKIDTCNECGSDLQWDDDKYICQKCYNRRFNCWDYDDDEDVDDYYY